MPKMADGSYKYINPNNPKGPMISRQRLWQIKKNKEGKCLICGKDDTNYGYCETHRLKHVENEKRRRRANN